MKCSSKVLKFISLLNLPTTADPMEETSLTVVIDGNEEQRRLMEDSHADGAGAESEEQGEMSARLKLLYPEVDEEEAPLPRCWSLLTGQHGHYAIGLEDHGRRVHFEGERGKKLSRSLLAQCNIPHSCGIFYYENTITSLTGSTSIAVGLVTSKFNFNR